MTEVSYAVADGIATITLDAPDRRNALSVEMSRELIDAARTAEADGEVGAVVVTGGEHFCAGAVREVLADVGERYGLTVLEPPIPKTVRFAEAPAVGRSILATARSSKGAAAYRDVAKGLLPHL